MRNKIKFALLAALLLQWTAVRATNFKEGFIITLKMDTVFGQVNNASYRKNSTVCTFRASKTDTIQTYGPDDLFGYRIMDGKYYISKYVPQQGKKMFLEYLVKGSLDVYFLQEADNVNRFYIAKDTLPLRLLKYELKDIYENGLHYQQLYNSSDSVLLYYTRDCPDMQPMVQNMKKPEHEKLIQFATEYHRRICPEGTCQVFEKKMPGKSYLTASAGVGYYPLPFTSAFDVINETAPSTYFSHAVNLFFQQPWISESTYFGIGYADFKRIPVSIYHFSEGKGLLPVVGYELDLNRFLTVQNIALGFRIPFKKYSIFLTGNVTTTMIITPVATSLRLGLMRQL